MSAPIPVPDGATEVTCPFDNIPWRTVLDVFVPGRAAPQGSKRAVGPGKMIEMSRHVKPWREDVRAACLVEWTLHDSIGPTAYLRPPIDGPVRLTIEFVRKRPASAPKKRTPWASTQPDASKLIRSTEDAITSAGVWADDARVVDVRAWKRCAEIGETPGARIVVQVPDDVA